MVNKIKKKLKQIKQVSDKMKSISNKIKKLDQIVQNPMQSLGGAVGARLGSRAIGSGVGKIIGKITGTGDYRVSNNSIYNQSSLSDTNVPQFVSTRRGTRVIHREYLGDIIASSTAGAYSVQSYALNPGLSTTFPWLAAFASQFDQWKPNGMVAVIQSLSSNYSATTSLGTVVLATDYDVLDAPYGSKIEAENSEFAVSGNTSQSLIHPIECKARERPDNLYFVRTTGVPSTDNARFYDLGNLQVITQGCVANQVVGELWISYDITFYKPQVYGAIMGKTVNSLSFKGTGTLTSASPFGTVQTYSAGSTFQVTTNLTDMTFPKSMSQGTFLVVMWFSGASTAITAPTVTYSSGTQAGPQINPGVSSMYASNGTSTVVAIVFTVKCISTDSTPQTITLTGGTYPTSLTGSYVTITQINPTL